MSLKSLVHSARARWNRWLFREVEEATQSDRTYAEIEEHEMKTRKLEARLRAAKAQVDAMVRS